MIRFKCITEFCFYCGKITLKENNFFDGIYICGMCQKKIKKEKEEKK